MHIQDGIVIVCTSNGAKKIVKKDHQVYDVR